MGKYLVTILAAPSQTSESRRTIEPGLGPGLEKPEYARFNRSKSDYKQI